MDTLLSKQDIEERLSKAYALAVAARAGYTTADHDLDRDGVDMRVQAGGDMRPAIDLQLKATINLGDPDYQGYFHFPLKRSNYKQLIIPTQTPRLLIVLDLPKDEAFWMTITGDELVLRRRAYWLYLGNKPESENASSVTVQIPEGNVFDVESLRSLMKQSRGGTIG